MADDFTTVEAAKITDLLLDQPQLAADLLRNDLKNAGSPQAQLALIGKIIAAQPADDTGTLVIGPIQQDGCGGPGTRSVAITYPGSDGAPVAEQVMTLQTRSMPCDQNGQPIATGDLPPAAPVVQAPGYDAGQAPPPPDAGYPLQDAGVPPAYYGSQDYVPYGGANAGYGAYAFSPYGMDDCYVEGAFIIGGNGMGMGGWGNRAWLSNQNRISQQYAQTYAPQNTSTIGNGAITQPGTTQNPGNGAIQHPGTNGSTVGNGSMQHITAPVTNKFYNTTNNYVTDTTNKNNTYVTIDKSHTTTIVNGNHDKVNDTIVRMPAAPAQPGHPQPGPIERTPPVAKPVPVAPAPIEKPPVAKPGPAGPAPIEQHPPGTPRPGFPPPGNQQGAPPREIHPPVPPPAAPPQGAPRDNTHPTPAAGPTAQQLEQQHLLQQQEQQRIKTQQDQQHQQQLLQEQQHQQQLQNQQRQDLQRQQQERQQQPIQHPAAPPRPVAPQPPRPAAAPPPRPAAAPPPRPAAAPPRPAAPPPHH